MQINKVQNNVSFGIKVAPHFSKTVQNFYHYGNIPNKRRFIWAFNQKAEKFAKSGFDDYTMDYDRKFLNRNWVHYIVATNDSNPKERIILSKKKSLAKIIIHFMEMNIDEFTKIMKSKKS